VSEIVIDANVFAHALNPANEFFDSAVSFVAGILETDLKMALDDTGKTSPSEWTSNIYREYTECISPTSVSYDVIRTMLGLGRVTFHQRPAKEKWAHCKKLTPANNNDAIVLAVGVQADGHLVVSNDYRDFHRKIRRSARQELGVEVLDSDELAATWD
jgi:hypothetical protein